MSFLEQINRGKGRKIKNKTEPMGSDIAAATTKESKATSNNNIQPPDNNIITKLEKGACCQ